MSENKDGEQKIHGLKDNNSFYLGVLRFILGYILTSFYHLFNFYEYYDDITDLKLKIISESENIQCIVANNFIENEVKFGQTQHPKLWDYADGVNTIEFLSKI